MPTARTRSSIERVKTLPLHAMALSDRGRGLCRRGHGECEPSGSQRPSGSRSGPQQDFGGIPTLPVS